jgi:cytochrome c-type biogenesis protein CcmE
MNQKFIRIGLTVFVLAASFGGLMWFSLREDTEYYKHVEEVMVSPQQWEGRPLQLHGYVVPGSITRARTDSLEWRFKVQNKGSSVNASYHGVVPDTFKDDAEVVLRGKLTPDGFNVMPNGVMAKCPSKYEPKAALTQQRTSN